MATVTQTLIEIGTFATREPRSSSIFFLKDVAGPLPEYLTSSTVFSLQESAVLNDDYTTYSYPDFLDSALISGTASISIKRTAAVTEKAQLFSRLTGGRRVSRTITEIAVLSSNYSYNNDRQLRDSAVLSTHTYPITRSRPVIRDTAYISGGVGLPSGSSIRDVAYISSVLRIREAGTFAYRETATVSAAPTFTLHSSPKLTESVNVSSRLTGILNLRPVLREIFYASDDITVPVTIDMPGSSNETGLAYTCSIATWGMSIFTGYAFNKIAGKYASGNNLWVIEGNTDNGKEIEASITTGMLDMGASQFKRPSAVYINGSAAAPLTVTVSGDCDGAPAVGGYVLDLRDETEYRNNRVLIGKGFRSRYLQLKIGGTGIDYRLISADIDVAVSNRRV